MYIPEGIMADDLDTLRMMRSLFGGSAPKSNLKKKSNKKKNAKKGYIPPTEKPLESVTAPWEYVLPQVRTMQILKMLNTGKDLKKLSEPASRDLMRRIEPSVRDSTGYSKKTTEALLRDLNRRNPLSKRMYEKIDDIGHPTLHGNVNPKIHDREKRERILKLMESLGYDGQQQAVVDPDEVISTPYGDMTRYEYAEALIEFNDLLKGKKDFSLFD